MHMLYVADGQLAGQARRARRAEEGDHCEDDRLNRVANTHNCDYK